MSISKAIENVRRFDQSKSLLLGLVDMDAKHNCEVCGEVVNVRGRLGPGTLISVKCPHCKQLTPIGVATGAEVASAG